MVPASGQLCAVLTLGVVDGWTFGKMLTTTSQANLDARRRKALIPNLALRLVRRSREEVSSLSMTWRGRIARAIQECTCIPC